MTYSQEQKEATLQELVRMAYADDRLQAEEVEFIKALGRRLEFTEQEVDDFINSPTDKEILPPKKFVERIVHFHRLMLMMHIDGSVDPAELQFLHEVALKYGMRRSTVLMLLEKMKEFKYGDIPPTELLAIHQQIHN
jgi:uncharacterized tellurite resistance protein B-like protein